MAKKSRMSVLKRQREVKKQEKAALKRERREQRKDKDEGAEEKDTRDELAAYGLGDDVNESSQAR